MALLKVLIVLVNIAIAIFVAICLLDKIMALLEVLLVLLNTAIAIFVGIIVYFKNCYSFWKNKNIPHLPPTIPLGNAQNPFMRKSASYEHVKFIYDKMKHQKAIHCGVYIFTKPTYVPIDLDQIRNVLTKDFAHFVDRGMYYNERDDPLSVQLVSIEGEKWKKLRAKLTPTFTSGKMKMMHPIIIDCARQMNEALEKMENCPIDIKELLGCYTTDVIGTCAFGIVCNSFMERESEFRKYGNKIFKPSALTMIKTLFSMIFASLSKKLRLKVLDSDVTDFFLRVVKETVKFREENDARRNDFMQILIDLKNNEGGFTVEEIAAQAFVFFLAGFETSSTTLTFCLYELAKNPEIQEKLREEIRGTLKKHGEFTYDALSEMKYMNQVIEETLRKYPPAPTINRICTKDYNLPGTNAILEKGVGVLVPTFAIHRDPELYPRPDQFEPERFSDENKHGRHPYAYLPFGEGPRSCIGMRFGLMQSKNGLAMLLKSYKFSLNFNTIEPLRFDKNSFMLATSDTIWLNATKLTE